MKSYVCLSCGTSQVITGTPRRCMKPQCRAGAAYLKEQGELIAGATAARASAMATQTGETLTAKLREPLSDVSAKAGKIERESPLFFGQGDNPTLF